MYAIFFVQKHAQKHMERECERERVSGDARVCRMVFGASFCHPRHHHNHYHCCYHTQPSLSLCAVVVVAVAATETNIKTHIVLYVKHIHFRRLFFIKAFVSTTVHDILILLDN